jgi:hypothetical protein
MRAGDRTLRGDADVPGRGVRTVELRQIALRRDLS